jgi:hypothetical protein
MTGDTLINVEYLKMRTGIDKNVDANKLGPHILNAQVLVIRDALCPSYYDDFYARFSSNTLTANEETLLSNYIAPTLAYQAYLTALSEITFKTTNKGTNKENSEWSQSVDLNEFKAKKNDIMNITNAYLLSLQKHLNDNSALYPARVGCCGKKTQNSGIWFKK